MSAEEILQTAREAGDVLAGHAAALRMWECACERYRAAVASAETAYADVLAAQAAFAPWREAVARLDAAAALLRTIESN